MTSSNSDTISDATGCQIIEAASLIVFRNNVGGPAPELLLIERTTNMRFAGGATVFPGGRVDPSDRELAASLGNAGDQADIASRIAAVRESLEETGLAVGFRQTVSAQEALQARDLLQSSGRLDTVLREFNWQLSLDELVPFARWLPLHHPNRAFDTRFYITSIGTGDVNVAADTTESRHVFWCSATDAIARADRGDISVIYPTRRNFERLAMFKSYQACRAHSEATPPITVTPEITVRDGHRWMTIPVNAGYPICEQRMPDLGA